MERSSARLLRTGAASLAACSFGEDDSAQDLSTVSLALTRSYEAESALLSAPRVLAAFARFTGTGYADYQAATGEFVEWTVQAVAAGSHQLAIRYADGATACVPCGSRSTDRLLVPTLHELGRGAGWSSRLSRLELDRRMTDAAE